MLFERIHLDADEKIIAVIRKHWWIIVVESTMVFVFATAPLFIYYMSLAVNAEGSTILLYFNNLIENYRPELWYAYFTWLLVIWMGMANIWTDYYLDLWAISSRRVILVDQRGFFKRFISSFRLERLQDMNIEINGIFATLLDFGTIEAQTAGGSNEEFISHNMPKPREIKAMIVEEADKLTATQAARVATLKEQGI